MRLKSGSCTVLLGILIVAPGVPLNTSWARAQQGVPQQAPSPPSQKQLPVPTLKGQGQTQQKKSQKATISAKSKLVKIDAVVTDQDGKILSGLKEPNFRILDDGKPQQITNFASTDAPATIVVLMEVGAKSNGDPRYWADTFLGYLNAKDWIALKTFDQRTTLQMDFTQDKSAFAHAINSFSFTNTLGINTAPNLFDVLVETLDQLRGVQGEKSIFVIATGLDSFSKHTLNQTLKRLKNTDVKIFCVGTAGAPLHEGDARILQANNWLTQFAQMTGGLSWIPSITDESPTIFSSAAAFLHNQYTIRFIPSTPLDGKYHKLKIEIVDEHGKPLMVAGDKGKMKKVDVLARQGYTAPVPTPAGN